MYGGGGGRLAAGGDAAAAGQHTTAVPRRWPARQRVRSAVDVIDAQSRLVFRIVARCYDSRSALLMHVMSSGLGYRD